MKNKYKLIIIQWLSLFLFFLLHPAFAEANYTNPTIETSYTIGFSQYLPMYWNYYYPSYSSYPSYPSYYYTYPSYGYYPSYQMRYNYYQSPYEYNNYSNYGYGNFGY